MLIKSVELKNIKSYRKERIDFSGGINGICGENGNGKTTLLEAIGYALFDFLPYNHTDFLRHGEKSGYVAVTVEGNDEIEYLIVRKIGSVRDYYIKTPVGEIKGKKDVTDWIGSHLFYNVNSEDELPSLFENMIGVPQGTFTTAFLQAARARKTIFDNILRVEEYKTAFVNLLPVINSIKKNIDSLEREIIPLKARTEKYPELKKEKESLQEKITELRTNVHKINARISTLKEKKEELTGIKSKLENLNSKLTEERVRLDGLEEQLEKARMELNKCESSKKIVEELTPSEESFRKENEKIIELNGSRIKRDRLKDEMVKIDIEISSLTEKLDQISRIAGENEVLEEKKEQLVPEIKAEHELENSISEIKNELRNPMAELISRISNLREKSQRLEEINREIAELEVKITDLLPLKDKQLETEKQIKHLKNELEIPLKELLTDISALNEKEVQSLKLDEEMRRLKARKNELLPALEKKKVLEDEIKNISEFSDSLTRLGFELSQAIEKKEHRDSISREIEELEEKSSSLVPLIEQQSKLETEQQELTGRRLEVKSRLDQIKNNIKHTGTKGLCPILKGIKCSSVEDFTGYFNNEIDTCNNEFREIDSHLVTINHTLDELNNPKKHREAIEVLILSKRKDLDPYKDAYFQVASCQSKIKELAGSYPLPGLSVQNGNEDEIKAIRELLGSRRSEYDTILHSTRELDNLEALIISKNRDLEELSDLKEEISLCHKRIRSVNDKFEMHIVPDNLNLCLEKVAVDIVSLEDTLEGLNDPLKQIDTVKTLIETRKKDSSSLKDVPVLIEKCLEELSLLNKRFNLKDRLVGDPDELALVDELIESKTGKLKILGSPKKQLEALEENIKKNLEDLKKLQHVPNSLECSRNERSKIVENLSRFDGLDKEITEVQQRILKLEPEHNKYLQALPLASKLEDRTREWHQLEEIIKGVKTALNDYSVKQEALLREFSEKDLDETNSKLEELGRTASAMSEAIKGETMNLERIEGELTSMESSLLKIKEIEKKLEKEKRFLSFSDFIRETIKNSSEYVIKEFIGEISSEANNIYCEIMNDFTAILEWTNNYDIEIESGGEVNSFRQLSGGEGMSAALSVRLALLKIISNSDFVFLDEPTQNMDETRRENLSEQIMNIKGFKQVFVISHDDTFNEKYANVIKIQKTGGESRVVSCST